MTGSYAESAYTLLCSGSHRMREPMEERTNGWLEVVGVRGRRGEGE